MLDHLVLITFICVALVSVLYIFYWNRLVATLFSLLIRFFSWRQGASRIWVHIGAVQISLLSGRIFLRDVRYHSSNQTIRIVKVQLIWRYWLHTVLSDESIGTNFGLHVPGPECRMQIRLEGVECFMYNRTAAFDSIVSQMASTHPDTPQLQPSKSRRSMDTRHSFQDVQAEYAAPSSLSHVHNALRLRTPTFLMHAFAWFRRQLPNLDPKQLMPIGIDVRKGVIIAGNPSTPSILVTEFENATGNFGITASRSEFDIHKQLLTLSVANVVLRFLENKQYGEPMTTIGEMIRERAESYHTKSATLSYIGYHRFGKLWRKLKLYKFFTKFLTKTPTPHRTFMRKAKQSIDEDTPIGVDFSALEYAVERNILQSPSIDLCYYVDVAGEVPALELHTTGIDTIGNGDAGPEWGVDMILHGGFIRYGPWADRQRGELQRAFFPPTYHDSEVTPRLQPGDSRLWTHLRVFIELREETTLQLPFKEASKNWQWDGFTEVRNRPKQREYAVIRLSAKDNSTINYTMPMLAGPAGYEPTLEVHIDTMEVTSSLNDIRLIAAESCRIRCDLPSPLKWNAPRTWSFNIAMRQPVLYLLRDHINMFVDLAKDWASGPPHDFFRFVPATYVINLDLHRYEWNMYANDHNIIDKPLVRDDNAFVTLRGGSLHHTTVIPSDVFRPLTTEVTFKIDAPAVSVNLSLPKWHTNAQHTPYEGHHIGCLDLQMDGGYRYFSTLAEDNTEQLKLKFMLKNVVFKALGWSIRYFMLVRENYFGSFTHFSTLYEYLERRNRGLPPGDPDLDKYRPGTTNMMQVILELQVLSASIILPAALTGYERPFEPAKNGRIDDCNIGHCLSLDLPELQVYLRLHDYFMDLSINVATVTGHILDECPTKVPQSLCQPKTRPLVVIDGIDITANRMFGPLPRTVTYICIWEIKIGGVKASVSATQSVLAMSALSAFKINLADAANAPAAEYDLPTYPDITFVKISLEGLDVVWKVNGAALHFSLPKGLRMDNNNIGGRFHRSLTSLRIPEAGLTVLANPSSRHNRWLEAASFVADVDVDIYTSPQNWRELAEDQLAYVTEQDAATNRASEMFNALWTDKMGPRSSSVHGSGVYVPQPLPAQVSRPSIGRDRGTQDMPKIPHKGLQSDSDDDRIRPNFDQDAKVAWTRASASVIHPVREEDVDDYFEMSGSEESDDDGLTDGYMSDSSVWSDVEKSIVDRDILHYSRFTRHYGGRSVSDPALWNVSPFFLMKDYKFATLGESKSGGLPTRPYDLLPDNNIEVTVFKVMTRKTVDFHLTPLALPVLTKLQDDVESISLTPELTVDAFLANYLSNLPTARKAHKNASLIDIDLASLRLHFPQRLGPDSEATGLCDVFVFGAHATMALQKGLHTLTASVSGAGAHFRVVGDLERKSGESLLAVDLGSLSVRLHQSTITLDVGSLSVDVDHALPEQIIGFAEAIDAHAQEIMSVARRSEQAYLQHKIRTVRGILTSCGDDTIVDPLSAVQPSYLVQSGIPQELRTDSTFRFLYHLRDCLWDIRDWDDEFADDANLDVLAPLLKKRLQALDPDMYHDGRIGILEPIFPGLRDYTLFPNPPDVGSHLSSLTFFLRDFALRVVDPASGPASSARLKDMHISGRTRLLDMRGDISPHDSRPSMDEDIMESVQAVSATIALECLNVVVYPHLMGFTQNILRSHRSASASPRLNEHRPETSEYTPHVPRRVMATRLDISTSLKTIRVQAIAANLMFELGLENVRHTSDALFGPHKKPSANNALLFDAVFLRARSPTYEASQSGDDVLASLDCQGGRVHALGLVDRTQGDKFRIAFDIRRLGFSVPRSALRLYRFFQDWHSDFIPGMRSTLKELVGEIKQAQDPASLPRSKSKEGARVAVQPNVLVNGHFGSLGILLQVMHGTWASWDIRSITVHGQTCPQHQLFGVQASTQTFSVFPKPTAADISSSAKVKFELPLVSVSSRMDDGIIKGVALIEFLDLKVKPSHWDTLMTVQQKFGQDFNDFLSLIRETRLKQSTSESPRKIGPKPKPPPKVRVSLKIQGFRIGLEGPSATVYLECLNIIGGVDTRTNKQWFVTLSDLALSLAPRAAETVHRKSFSRQARSAFVVLDFKIHSKGDADESGDTISVNVTKIHAVMQPSSIGLVGDFIDDMQSEILVRREQRAHELAAFKEKTQQIFSSFEIKMPRAEMPETVATSFLGNYSVDLTVTNVGVAFPLTHDNQLNLTKYGSHDSHSVRAFLFSISSIQFGTVRGVTGEAVMKGFSFQFVHRFKQSVASDFSGDLHSTRNRLVYPEMTASMRSISSPTSRKILMNANVSGFMLDIDSTIPDYVFSLIDVYRRGKERLSQLAQTKPPSTPQDLHRAVTPEPTRERPKGIIPTSIFCGSLAFLSGKVRMYSTSASQKSRRGPILDPTDDQVTGAGGEIFRLPGVSVWMEYRATPASHKYGESEKAGEASLLMFKSTVHSSQNTLSPTLLPFITEVVNRVERRMRAGSGSGAQLTHLAPPTPLVEPSNLTPTLPSESSHLPSTRSDPNTGSMRVSFSLRIDKSRLELTCKPDVNVVAAVQWESGGFMLNASPGARNVSFTGSVGGLTVGLRHGFLSEDCVNVDARNLVFIVDFSKVEPDDGPPVSTVSVVLDTEFWGGVHFSRLQDVLCFKAVWLDRIPVFGQSTSVLKPAAKPATPEASIVLHPLPPEPQQYSTILLIRIRHIKLDVDLGQSISMVVCDIKDAVLRTQLTEAHHNLSFSVADVSLTARGNVAGKVHVPDCVFQTVRRTEHVDGESHGRMLELRMMNGPFVASLESEHQKLLQYRAGSLNVEIYDDWSRISDTQSTGNQPLQLSFTIFGPEIVAAVTIGTIPQVLSYVNKFKANLELQKEGARRESETFRATQVPKPDHPLSTVAEAMIYSARDRIKAENNFMYTILQSTSLRLNLLRLIVFPRSMNDVEAAQFIGRDIRARLNRHLESKKPSQRDIHLSFTQMTISRLSQLGHTASALSDNQEWLKILMKGASEATIIGLPAMHMHMLSEELFEDGHVVLSYDFESRFLRNETKKTYDDIYIALNVSLYSWLAVLRKTLTRDLDQVKATSDWRTTLATSANVPTLRRKGPDILNQLESARSTLPPSKPGSVTPTTATDPSQSGPSPLSFTLSGNDGIPMPASDPAVGEDSDVLGHMPPSPKPGVIYRPRRRHIERLNMRQLGEATPNVMHPFFMKKAGFSLEDSLPQYVNDYATTPLEEIMEILLKLYSKQLLDGQRRSS